MTDYPGTSMLELTGKYARGRVALIDTVELPKCSPYQWRVAQTIRANGRLGNSYVVAGRSDSGLIRLHTLITGYRRTDHINGDGLDNRRANLRPAMPPQNAANRGPRPGTVSQYKGVHWEESLGKWRPQIKDGPDRPNLGVFTDERDAALVYDAAAREAFGEFAWLNFPEVTGPPPRPDRSGFSSDFWGVSRYRSGKWKAYITVRGKRQHLGYYTDEIEAARVHDAAAREAFGDSYYRLNFPGATREAAS